MLVSSLKMTPIVLTSSSSLDGRLSKQRVFSLVDCREFQMVELQNPGKRRNTGRGDQLREVVGVISYTVSPFLETNSEERVPLEDQERARYGLEPENLPIKGLVIRFLVLNG